MMACRAWSYTTPVYQVSQTNTTSFGKGPLSKNGTVLKVHLICVRIASLIPFPSTALMRLPVELTNHHLSSACRV
jgi:hypothetical protein